MSARVHGERRRPDRKAASQLGRASVRRHEKSTRNPSRAMLPVTRLAGWQRYRDKNSQDRNRRSAPHRLACRTPSYTTEVPPIDPRALAASTVACRTLPAGARSQWLTQVADGAPRRTCRHPVPVPLPKRLRAGLGRCCTLDSRLWTRPCVRKVGSTAPNPEKCCPSSLIYDCGVPSLTTSTDTALMQRTVRQSAPCTV